MFKTLLQKIKGGEEPKEEAEQSMNDKQRKAMWAKRKPIVVDKSIFKTYKFEPPPKDFELNFNDLLFPKKPRGKKK